MRRTAIVAAVALTMCVAVPATPDAFADSSHKRASADNRRHHGPHQRHHGAHRRHHGVNRYAIEVLSSRPDLITGGDALVRVTVKRRNVSPTELRVELNGVDVTWSFVADPMTRTLTGLVSGMRLGENLLEVIDPRGNVRGRGRADADIVLTNHPVTGPVLSGPHKTPFECRTVESGLAFPIDMDCSVEKQVSYFYRASDHTFKPLMTPGVRPDDLAFTTTIEGKRVPYIVRVESGTINRGIYNIAVLDDPTQQSASGGTWAGAGDWNRKLVVFFGGGCGNQYNQGINPATSVLSALHHMALSQGFALVNSSLLVNQNNCNPHVQGETLMMLKEYFTERYGVPKWVVGLGGSGGAIQQYHVAELYPGLLDGIIAANGFPDAYMDLFQCRLLRAYYRTDPETWTIEKQTAVEGYSAGTCAVWDPTFAGAIDAINGVFNARCGLKDQSLKFDPVTNPTGARCDVYSANVNALGRNPVTGYARRPWDNIGFQYGLGALQNGDITMAEFLDLNENIGGFDVNGQIVATRTEGNPEGIRRLFSTGLMNTFGGGIPTVPIITARINGSTVGDIHDRLQDFVIRARIEAAHGRSDNQIILTAGLEAARAGVNLWAVSFDIMNRWLDAIAADPASSSTDKVVRNKPADARDTCWTPTGEKFFEPAALGDNRCNELYPLYSSPMLVAGGPITKDVMKCQLKPIDLGDYPGPESAAEKARLRAIFPMGVCDWSKPDPYRQPLAGTYLDLPLSD